MYIKIIFNMFGTNKNNHTYNIDDIRIAFNSIDYDVFFIYDRSETNSPDHICGQILSGLMHPNGDCEFIAHLLDTPSGIIVKTYLEVAYQEKAFFFLPEGTGKMKDTKEVWDYKFLRLSIAGESALSKSYFEILRPAKNIH